MLFKRLFDLTAALVGLLALLLPFALLCAIVKLSSYGHVFFIQQRVGRHGRLFPAIKFRTMYVGTDTEGSVTVSADARIAPIGRWLRKYKLDEYPQLWNVLAAICRQAP
jgi:lipopolysaccharide/colanic/teichoic acid biosynthesis glycosyltransferase